jgi:fibronectin-binding autotransporter adhesin
MTEFPLPIWPNSVFWRLSRGRLAVALLIAVSTISASAATNGTWTDATSGGLWSDPANWSGGAIADGTDGIADFSTLNITADNTVHLSSARSIGSLKFGDTTPSNNWLLDNNGNSANSLNLAASSGTPLIQVNNGTATVSTVLTGTQGVTETGSGTLIFSGGNTYSGGIAITNGGHVVLNASSTQSGGAIVSGPLGIGPITLGTTGATSLTFGTSSGFTVANPIVASSSGTFTPSIASGAPSGVNTFSGNITLGTAANVGKTVTIGLSSNANGELDFTGNILANGTDTSAGLQISVASSGTIRLTGNNTYAGGTTMTSNFGTLILDPDAPSNTVLGTGPLTVSGNLQLRSSSVIATTPLIAKGSVTIALSGITAASDTANVTLNQFGLNLAGPSTLPNSPYSVSLGTGPGSKVTVAGSAFKIAKNGTGTGTLPLGPLFEASSSPNTDTFTGGTIILNSPAASFPDGYAVKINSATTLSSNNSTALGVGAGLTLSGSGATFNVGATQQVKSLSGVSGSTANLNPSGIPSQLTLGSGSYAGAIVGDGGSIVKVSSGLLTLSGSNSYSGGTTIAAGEIQFNGDAAIPSGVANVVVSPGAIIGAGAAIDQTFVNHISNGSPGVVALSANSGNALDLSQATGANLPAVTMGATGTFSYSGTLTPFGTAYAFGGGNGVLTIASPLVDSPNGATSLTLGGNLTLILAGNNSYSGGTAVNGGLLQFNGDSAIPNGVGNVTINAATIAAGAAIDQAFLNHINSSSIGVVALALNSSNNLDLSQLSGTPLPTVSLGAIGSIAFNGTLTPFGTSYQFGGGGGTLTVGGVLKDSPAGPSKVTVGSNLTLLPTANNTYSGGTVINGGAVQISADSASIVGGVGTSAQLGQLPEAPTMNLFLNNGTLKTNGTFTLNALRGIALGPPSGSQGGSGTIEINGGNTLTILGIVGDNSGGPGMLTKTGSGTLALGGDNTYSGGTTIVGGNVLLLSNNALGTGKVTGGGLELPGGVTITNPLVASSTFITHLTNIAGDNTYSGNISGNAFLINSAAGSTLTLSGTLGRLELAGAGNFAATGSFGSPYALTYSGSGTLTLGDQDQSLGFFLEESGTVRVATPKAVPLFRPGSDVGGTGNATIEIISGDFELPDQAAVPGAVQLGDNTGRQCVFAGVGNVTCSGTLIVQGNSTTLRSTIPGGALTLNGTLEAGTNTFMDGGGNIVVGGSIPVGGLTYRGSGVLFLLGSNSYTGGTTVSSGLVLSGSTTGLGTGGITLSGGRLRLSPAGGATLAGFGGRGAFWSLNDNFNFVIVSGQTSSPPFPALDILQLTDGHGAERRSSFYSTAVPIAKNGAGFTASFTYTETPGATTASGATFVLQNAGLANGGRLGGSGPSLGYGSGNGGSAVTPSVAIEFNISTSAPGGVGTALGINGSIPMFSPTGTVNLASGDPINVTVAYDPNAFALTETLTDSVNGNTFTTNYPGINLSNVLGGNTAYVGFTGSTGSTGGSVQQISRFVYTHLAPDGVYVNNVVLSSGTNSTIDVAATAVIHTTMMGTLTVNGPAASVLNVTAATAPPDLPYGLTLGSTTLSGNVTFNVANNGAGTGTLTLGATSGNGYGMTKTGPGLLLLPGVNTYTGNTIVSAGVVQVTGALASNGSATTFISAGTDFTMASLIRRVQPEGTYAGFGASSGGIALGSSADIRAGHNNSVAAYDLAMQWRFHNAATDGPGLISDVLNLTGMSSSSGGHLQTDSFLLQMTYNAATLGPRESMLAASGLIELAWLNSCVNQPNGLWQNATIGNFGAGLSEDVFQNVQSSWDAFAAANSITDSNIGNFLGSYGVDVAHHQVWAVVNHNSQFAVVPEPSALILLLIGGLALSGSAARRRRRVHGSP